MTPLVWALVIAGPFIGLAAGAVAVHYGERRHWHQLGQQWYDDGRYAGWEAHTTACKEVPLDLPADPPTLLDPALEGWQPWLELDEAFTAAFAAIEHQTSAARAQLATK